MAEGIFRMGIRGGLRRPPWRTGWRRGGRRRRVGPRTRDGTRLCDELLSQEVARLVVAPVRLAPWDAEREEWRRTRPSGCDSDAGERTPTDKINIKD